MCFKQHVRSFGRKRFEVISLCGGGGLKLNICITLFVRHNWKIPRTSFLSLEYSNCEVIFCDSFDWFLTRWLTHRDGRYLNLLICSRTILWETSFPQLGDENDKNNGCKVFLYTHFSFSSKGLLLHWKMWKDLFWWATRRLSWQRACWPCLPQFCHFKLTAVLSVVYQRLSMSVDKLQGQGRHQILRVERRQPFYRKELSEKHPWKRSLRTAERILHWGIKLKYVIRYFEREWFSVLILA